MSISYQKSYNDGIIELEEILKNYLIQHPHSTDKNPGPEEFVHGPTTRTRQSQKPSLILIPSLVLLR